MKDGNVLFQVTIKNHKGISLPQTGGIGTTGFMVAGAALLVIGRRTADRIYAQKP